MGSPGYSLAVLVQAGVEVYVCKKANARIFRQGGGTGTNRFVEPRGVALIERCRASLPWDSRR